jgi:hypothetical protein
MKIFVSIGKRLTETEPATGGTLGHRRESKMETPFQDHGVGFRTTGYRQIIGVHTLFPRSTVVSETHDLAAVLEEHLPAELGMTAEINTGWSRWKAMPRPTTSCITQ